MERLSRVLLAENWAKSTMEFLLLVRYHYLQKILAKGKTNSITSLAVVASQQPYRVGRVNVILRP